MNVTTEDLARNMRVESLKMVHRARASHIGSALSICDIVAVLYGSIMNVDSHKSDNPLRDRFILSKGHACVAVYAALYLKKFIDEEQVQDYGNDYALLMNHISHKVNGVEFSTGALGHGLPFGVGKALAAKIKGQTWRTFVVLSDGEMDEGSNWEALMFASHHKLNHVTAIIDYNKLQSLGSVASTLGLEPLKEKIEAFGCQVTEVNGHDHQQLMQALSFEHSNKPHVVIAHTLKGKGVSYMEDRVEWHYKNPSDEQLALALKELGV